MNCVMAVPAAAQSLPVKQESVLDTPETCVPATRKPTTAKRGVSQG